MKLTLGNNASHRIPGRSGRKALVVFLKTGDCVYGFEPTTGAADTLGAELGGGGVFNTGWSVTAGSDWHLDPAYAEYDSDVGNPAWQLKRSITGMTPYGAHKLVITTTTAITGTYSISLGGQAVGVITAVGTLEIIVYPGAASEDLIIAPHPSAGPMNVHITAVSLKAFVTTEGIPLPIEQQVAFVADEPRSFAGPVYLAAGAAGAEVIITERM